MAEGVCAFQEGVYANEVSLFEMASGNLSSLFSIFFSLRLVTIDGGKPMLQGEAPVHTRQLNQAAIDLLRGEALLHSE